VIRRVFLDYDICDSGALSAVEARSLFIDLARTLETDLATPSHERREQSLPSYEPSADKPAVPGAARAHAQRVLAQDETGNTIERIATKLMLLADENRDGRVSLSELAQMFDAVYTAN